MTTDEIKKHLKVNDKVLLNNFNVADTLEEEDLLLYSEKMGVIQSISEDEDDNKFNFPIDILVEEKFYQFKYEEIQKILNIQDDPEYFL